ncbi:hypothetical protein AB5I41_08545 [Sphingomonas sp. MMS24-JH45]
MTTAAAVGIERVGAVQDAAVRIAALADHCRRRVPASVGPIEVAQFNGGA